ncbi:MAG: hypothetical protein PUK05_04275 [Peptoniphilaceae bacterium]|nr:hypothetical protein [Peptoniphilaceae bacterium]MDY5766532.1 hypothetical protein [Peptoniphilaceae bacterium]
MKKFSVLLIAILLFAGNIVYADTFNNSSYYESYSGGFKKNTFGSNGKHWTKYSIYQPGEPGIWCRTTVAGRGEAYDADRQYTYAIATYSVDFYHQHTHSHGALRQ